MVSKTCLKKQVTVPNLSPAINKEMLGEDSRSTQDPVTRSLVYRIIEKFRDLFPRLQKLLQSCILIYK